MPYRTVYADAEIFLKHQGVCVFHVYLKNDMGSGRQVYEYALVPNSDYYLKQIGPQNFDIRLLPNWRPEITPPLINASRDPLHVVRQKQQAWDDYRQRGGELEHIRNILREAIGAGYLTAHEIRLPHVCHTV